jgi:membrane protein DedA with SNARE-associated domain
MEKLFQYLLEMNGLGAYAIVFGILVACGLGFPLPEDIPLIAAGYLVWDGTAEWVPMLAITMGGVLLGDSILFFLGRNLGVRILEGRAQTLFPPAKVRRTRAYFRKYGEKIVFFARFVAGIRAVVFFMAGALKMRYQRFLFLDGVAAALSVPIWIALGYGMGNYFGDEIGEIIRNAKQFKNAFSILIAVLVVGLIARAYWRYRKAQALAKRGRAVIAGEKTS